MVLIVSITISWFNFINNNSKDLEYRTGAYFCKISIIKEGSTKVHKWDIGVENGIVKEILLSNISKTTTPPIYNVIADPGGGGLSWTLVDTCFVNADVSSFKYGFIKYKESSTGRYYWELEPRGSYTSFILQTSSNATDLANFDSAVYNMYYNFRAISAKLGGSAALVLLAAIASSSPPSAVAIAVAMFGYGKVTGIDTNIENLINYRSTADRYYNEVMND